MQLHSKARVLVALGEDSGAVRERKRRRKPLNVYVNEIGRALHARHQVYAFTFLREGGEEIAGEVRVRGRPFSLPVQSRLACAGRACEERAKVLAGVGGGAAMLTVPVLSDRYIDVDMKKYGAHGRIVGPERRVLEEIGRKFRIAWKVANDAVFWKGDMTYSTTVFFNVGVYYVYQSCIKINKLCLLFSQGNLFTLMTNPEFYPEIDTFAQLAESNLLIVAHSNRFLTRSEKPDPKIYSGQELENRYRVGRLSHRTISVDDLKALMCNHTPFAIITGSQYPELEMGKGYGLWKDFRVMRETIEERMNLVHARRNWPWTEAVNALYMQFDAAGLREFWGKDYETRFALLRNITTDRGAKIQQTAKRSGNEEAEGSSLRLQDMVPPLQLLGAGLAVSGIALCTELLASSSMARAALSRLKRWARTASPFRAPDDTNAGSQNMVQHNGREN
ncbi:Protein of unknown function [Gryllus bimaculatus]|nr:Protein of unknown function [Gryllus bimaculatus]